MSATPTALLAHASPGGGWTGWSFDPLVVAGIAAASAAYGIGVRTLRRSPGADRVMPAWRPACFAAGIGALVAALFSPLDHLSGELLAAHMVQHLLLIVVAAPLLALGAPSVPLFLALPRTWRATARSVRRVPFLHAAGRSLTHPVAAWLVYVSVLWAWHVPALFDAAVENEVVHAVEHAAFLGTALLFWWPVIRPAGRGRLSPGGDVLYVFAASMQGGALGALLTFASSPLYPVYARGGETWGLSPLQDQQLAGLIMWIPAGLVYLAAASVLFVGWLRWIQEGEMGAGIRSPIAAPGHHGGAGR